MQTLNSHTEKVKDLIDFTAQSTSYSPFSLMHALLLLTYCSDDESIDQLTKSMQITKQELLDFSNELQQDKSIAIASNIFSKNIGGVNSAFKKLMKRTFGFTPEKLKSASQVNKWCAKHTNNRIDHLLDSVDFEAILLSAIHFKADWSIPFDSFNTQVKPFSSFTQNISKNMMDMTKHLLFAETSTAFIVNLAYSNSNLSAQIILPKYLSKSDFVDSLKNENVNPVFEGFEDPIFLGGRLCHKDWAMSSQILKYQLITLSLTQFAYLLVKCIYQKRQIFFEASEDDIHDNQLINQLINDARGYFWPHTIIKLNIMNKLQIQVNDNVGENCQQEYNISYV
ncbi:Serpin_1 [Hexamita inflata]|uniref:Serpin 1 n=1 Tax=Hexamita inflata TaxID=28002 RepID=A0AA86RJ61_9EUKA|nr:Serpin 1 [Hexamita inflata]